MCELLIVQALHIYLLYYYYYYYQERSDGINSPTMAKTENVCVLRFVVTGNLQNYRADFHEIWCKTFHLVSGWF